MRNENILKTLIVLTGVGVSYFKYNSIYHYGFEYLLLTIILLVVTFFTSIYLFNKVSTTSNKKQVVEHFSESKKIGLKKGKTINENIHSILRVLLVKSNLKEYLFLSLFSVFVAVILGFYYKKPNGQMLKYALKQKTEWKKDLFIEQLRSQTSFFQLNCQEFHFDRAFSTYSNKGDFLFNWEVFLFTLLSILVIYFVCKKINFDLIKQKITPLLK